jgi:hypothetical protein
MSFPRHTKPLSHSSFLQVEKELFGGDITMEEIEGDLTEEENHQ